MDDVISLSQEKMDKTLQALKKELAAVRAGRANASVLDKISVDYYGTPTPINQLGNISIPEARLLQISLWDVKAIPLVEKAIQKSDIGINPMNDGKVIRLAFPELTEERRKELVKQIKKDAEEYKVTVRSVRRDAIEQLKKQKNDSEITEDDLKIAEKDMQKITDDAIKEIDNIVGAKEKEIMEI